MIKKFVLDLKNIDFKIFDVMNKGFKISLVILLIASYVLALYIAYPFSHIAYFCGLSLFRLSITSFSVFLVCGIAVNKMNKKS